MPTYLLSRGNLLSNRLTNHVLSGVDQRFHPVLLLSVDTITEDMRVAPRPSRTGVIHPLPFARASGFKLVVDVVVFSIAPLRTTPEGIRLEITPTAMVLRNRPEEEAPAVTEPPIPSEHPSPETRPEC